MMVFKIALLAALFIQGTSLAAQDTTDRLECFFNNIRRKTETQLGLTTEAKLQVQTRTIQIAVNALKKPLPESQIEHFERRVLGAERRLRSSPTNPEQLKELSLAARDYAWALNWARKSERGLSRKPPYAVVPMAERVPGEYHGEHLFSHRRSEPIRYYTPQQREKSRVIIKKGLLYDSEGNLVDTQDGFETLWDGKKKPKTAADFVMDREGNLYLMKDKDITFDRHSSFLGAAPVAGAGEIQVIQGRVTRLSDGSGHYRPTPALMTQVSAELKRQGILLSPSQLVLSRVGSPSPWSDRQTLRTVGIELTD